MVKVRPCTYDLLRLLKIDIRHLVVVNIDYHSYGMIILLLYNRALQ